MLPVEVKTPNSIFREHSSSHLDSFLNLPREGSCRFIGELPNDSLTWHLRSKWRKRKASACLQLGTHAKSWERGCEQPLELQQQMCSKGVQAEASVEEGDGVRYQYSSATSLAMASSETWDRAGSLTLRSSTLQVHIGWLFFLEPLRQRLHLSQKVC